MSNYHVEPIDRPQALAPEAIKSLRRHQVKGLSRRQLLRYSLGLGGVLWMTEVLAGTIGFLWPNLSGGFGGKVKIGSFEDIKLANSNLPISDGFPAYVPDARSMDRFSASVDSGGVLTLDTGKITLGPLPVAVGQPGIIPPRTPTG